MEKKEGTKSWWTQKWETFSENHPKAAKWLYQIFYFWVFSMG